MPEILGCTLSTWRTIFMCLKDASQGVPVPGLNAAFVVTFSILEIADTVNQTREQCIQLAMRTSELVLALHAEYDDRKKYLVNEHFNELYEVLSFIESHMKKICKLSWFQAFWRRASIEDHFRSCTARLNDCINLFQVKSTVEIRRLLLEYELKRRTSTHEILATLQEMRLEATREAERHHNSIMERLQVISQDRNVETNVSKAVELTTENEAILDEADIIPKRELEPLDILIQQTGTHPDIVQARHHCKLVTVRQYRCGQKQRDVFLRDLRAWRSLWHPSFPNLIGHSKVTEQEPYIVLSGVSSRDICAFISSSTLRGKVDSFITGLFILEGIASALLYLRANFCLSSGHFANIIKPSNMYIGLNEQIILGEDIFIHPPEKQDYDPTRHDNWLCDQFWPLSNQILCGGHSNKEWHYAGGDNSASHLRALRRLATWSPTLTMDHIFRSLQSLKKSIVSTREGKGSITFSEITDLLLSASRHNQTYSYIPPSPWAVDILDIGYVRDGAFTKLCDFSTECQGITVRDDRRLSLKSDPPQDPIVTKRGNISSYAFSKPHCAMVVRQSSDANKSIAPEHKYRVACIFREHAHRIHQKYAVVIPDLRLRDLIIVAGVTDQTCSAVFEVHSNDLDQTPFDCVYLHERHAGRDGPWAFWSLDPKPSDESNIESQVSIPTSSMFDVAHSVQCLDQCVYFMQLEDPE